MSDNKKTLILEHVEKSKKGNWDAYINNFPKFVEDLNLNIQEAQYIFDDLAQIVSKQREESPSNDPCEFSLHAHDIFYGMVEDYKNNNDEDDSLKDLIKE